MEADLCFYAFATQHCPQACLIVPYVHLSGQMLLPWYLINGLNDFDKTDGIFTSTTYWQPDQFLEIVGQRWSRQAIEVKSSAHYISRTTWAI